LLLISEEHTIVGQTDFTWLRIDASTYEGNYADGVVWIFFNVCNSFPLIIIQFSKKFNKMGNFFSSFACLLCILAGISY